MTIARGSRIGPYEVVSLLGAGGMGEGVSRARAEGLLAELGASDSYGAPIAWFNYYLGRLDFDQAAEWIEKAIDQHDQRATYGLPYLRTTSRWPVLAKKLNVPGP